MPKTLTPTAVYAKATTSFATDTGRIVRLEAGEAWASSDPVVVAHRPDLFSDHPLVRVSDRSGLVAVEDL